MTELPLFLAAVVAILATPGPTNTLLMASGAMVGWRRSLPLLPAELSAYLITVGVLTAIGGPVVAKVPAVGVMLRLLLVAYVLYLAWQLWTIDEAVDPETAKPVTGRQVFITTLLNPKGLVFAFAVFPPLASLSQVAIHFGLFAVTVPIIATAWIVFGATARRGFPRLARRHVVSRLAALALAVFACLIAGTAIATVLKEPASGPLGSMPANYQIRCPTISWTDLDMLDRLTLDQLRVLVAVAETGSFSAAARKLGRVQSAISQAIQSLESTLALTLFERDGKLPKLNDAGRTILAEARRVIAGADRLKARAEDIADDVEPELTLAVDAIFPAEVLKASLRALGDTFPMVPVTLFTEGLGGAEQRLRDGVARLAICLPLPNMSKEHWAEPLVTIPTVPVVAAGHPLAKENLPIPVELVADQLQLVLTDRTPITAGFSGSVISTRTWRFADLGTRLEFLLAGFGWCNMPVHMVRDHVVAGRLKVIEIANVQPPALPLSVVLPCDRGLGKAGRWLIDDIRERIPQCAEPMSLPSMKVPGTAEAA